MREALGCAKLVVTWYELAAARERARRRAVALDRPGDWHRGAILALAVVANQRAPAIPAEWIAAASRHGMPDT
jgi:hypothetical protein